eukprot:620226-Alexandrium_andersonii.AAC.1
MNLMCTRSMYHERVVQGVGEGMPRFRAARRAGGLKYDIERLLLRAGRSSSGRSWREPSANVAPKEKTCT